MGDSSCTCACACAHPACLRASQEESLDRDRIQPLALLADLRRTVGLNRGLGRSLGRSRGGLKSPQAGDKETGGGGTPGTTRPGLPLTGTTQVELVPAMPMPPPACESSCRLSVARLDWHEVLDASKVAAATTAARDGPGEMSPAAGPVAGTAPFRLPAAVAGCEAVVGSDLIYYPEDIWPLVATVHTVLGVPPPPYGDPAPVTAEGAAEEAVEAAAAVAAGARRSAYFGREDAVYGCDSTSLGTGDGNENGGGDNPNPRDPGGVAVLMFPGPGLGPQNRGEAAVPKFVEALVRQCVGGDGGGSNSGGGGDAFVRQGTTQPLPQHRPHQRSGDGGNGDENGGQGGDGSAHRGRGSRGWVRVQHFTLASDSGEAAPLVLVTYRPPHDQE